MSDWREQVVHKVRALVLEAAPDATEDVKWRKASNPDGVPTFSLDGLICTVATLTMGPSAKAAERYLARHGSAA